MCLQQEIENKTYEHSPYFSFYVKDPKLRRIHKASVKDRVLHHAVFQFLYPIFDKSFIFDSYSCRLGKGTHRAVNRLDKFAKKVGKNNSKNCFVLKLDIKKFFNSVNQNILIGLIEKEIIRLTYVNQEDIMNLVKKIVLSFKPNGLPLGNITSQLFANVYLDKFDQFVKHKLKIKYYIRYCDDFLILSRDRIYLENLIPLIDNFLQKNLKLALHPNKITIRKYRQGIDFLGYVCFPYHRILRPKTRKRMIKNICPKNLQSYLGVLKHCNDHKIKLKLLNTVKSG